MNMVPAKDYYIRLWVSAGNPFLQITDGSSRKMHASNAFTVNRDSAFHVRLICTWLKCRAQVGKKDGRQIYIHAVAQF